MSQNYDTNSWIGWTFGGKSKAFSLAKEIKSALKFLTPKYGDAFVMVRVGDYPKLTKKEQSDIDVPVSVGHKGIEKGAIQFVLHDKVSKRRDLKDDN